MLSPSTMTAIMLAQERTEMLRQARRNVDHSSADPRRQRALRLSALRRNRKPAPKGTAASPQIVEL